MQGHPRLHNEVQANVAYMTQCLKTAQQKTKNHMHPWVHSEDTERMEWLVSRNAGRQDRVLINRMDEKMKEWLGKNS